MTTASHHPNGRYFQFPLCALAFEDNETERLNCILDYAVVVAGTKLWRKMPADEKKRLWTAWTVHGKAPIGFDYQNEARVAGLAGANILSTVRLRKDWLFDVRDRRGLTYREFAALVAIYSVIGNKPEPVLVTQAVIRQRALGYKSAAVKDAEFPLRKDGLKPLTDWEL